MSNKTGNVRMKDYEVESYVAKYAKIESKLNKDFPDIKTERKTLSLTVGKLLQFMEDTLGKDASGDKPFPKIPAKLFRDFSGSGSLHCILSKMYEWMQFKEWDTLDFGKERRDEVMDMLRVIRGDLMGREFIKPPRVYLTSGLKGDNKKKAKELIRAFGGDVTDSAATATHHLYPDDPNDDPNDQTVYLRALERRTGEARVHWWYKPDSYDEWVPEGVVEGNDDEPDIPTKQWKVYMRWVTDTALYNEWMNETDYDSKAEFAAEPAGGVEKRKAEEAMGTGKRQRTEGGAVDMDGGDDEWGTPAKGEVEQPEVLPGGEPVEGAPVEVVKVPVGQPHSSVEAAAVADAGGGGPPAEMLPGQPPAEKPINVENISQGQRTEEDARAESEAADKAKEGPTHTRELYRVPSHAAWFAWSSIHELERRGVPEFFNGTSSAKTPKSYREYRDAIINKYRENVRRRLTFTECRRFLAGDVNAIHRIFSFLEHWGLINFLAEGSAGAHLPLAPQVTPTPVTEGDSAARMVTGPAPGAPSASSLFAFKPPAAEGAAAAMGTGGDSSSLMFRKSSLGRSALERAGAVEFACDLCKQRCNKTRYHCQKRADYDLCPACFAEGKFAPGLSSVDFLRLDGEAPKGASEAEWTDQETLLLLEALELYGDNWHDVAEHVGTKTQPQCILHFIQMPIEDPFLDELTEPKPKPAKEAGAAAAAAAAGEEAKGGEAGEEATPMDAEGVGAEGGGEGAGAGAGGAEAAPPPPPWAPHPEAGDAIQDIPFADASNPVMAQVAFLASMVGPRVAAAAAQAALNVLSEEEPATAPEVAEGTALADAAAAAAGAEGTDKAGEEAAAAAAAEGGKEGAAPADGVASAAAAPEGGEVALAAAAEGGPEVAGGGEAKDEAEEIGPSSVKMRAAAATALAAAAVKAKLLADQEEREIQKLVVSVIEDQQLKLEHKLKHFEDLEKLLESEREQIEQQRQQLYADRVQFQAARIAVPQLGSRPSAGQVPQGQ